MGTVRSESAISFSNGLPVRACPLATRRSRWPTAVLFDLRFYRTLRYAATCACEHRPTRHHRRQALPRTRLGRTHRPARPDPHEVGSVGVRGDVETAGRIPFGIPEDSVARRRPRSTLRRLRRSLRSSRLDVAVSSDAPYRVELDRREMGEPAGVDAKAGAMPTASSSRTMASTKGAGCGKPQRSQRMRVRQE
jgi:hypothetical protein